ncbi:MAG TPA: V-type ATP synthase subunit E family protein [Candidatus Brocadiia bacterium]|nr:V-type ATP synthase subunit E family protein [Candidatus Brocadiia bacterium]
MSLDNIKKAVLAEAEAEARHLVAAAERKAERRFKEAEAAIRREADAKLAGGKQAIDDSVGKDLLRLRSELAVKLLEEKNRILARIFDAALQSLASMPREQYISLLEGWLAGLEEGAGGEVALNLKDSKEVGPELIKRLNARLGQDFARLADQPADIKGGLIFRSSTFEMDRSFDTLMRNAREELTPELAREAFPSLERKDL